MKDDIISKLFEARAIEYNHELSLLYKNDFYSLKETNIVIGLASGLNIYKIYTVTNSVIVKLDIFDVLSLISRSARKVILSYISDIQCI